MPATRTQTRSSHIRFEPAFHFLLAPIFLINIIVAITLAVRRGHAHLALHIWSVVMAIALLLFLGTMRRYALKDQDRIIRLEERLRLAALLPPAEHPLITTLTTRQLIALRFASDAELPALARRAAAESLTPAQIKQSITTWRPDYERI